MTAAAVIALRAHHDDVTVVVREASTLLRGQAGVEVIEMDPRKGLDLHSGACDRAQLLTLSPSLYEDAEAADLVASVEDRFVRLASAGQWAWYLTQLDPRGPPPWPWVFTCNICGTENQWSERPPGREGPSCTGCRSNVRYRATVKALLTSLLGTDEPLSTLVPRREIRGLGIGDWPGYADGLATAFSYTNTRLDTEPRLDLMDEPGPDLLGAYDFVVAGDVLEHVAPPVETAMANLRRLLRPGGVAILTVPFSGWREHIEHFPRLHRWRVEVGQEGDPVLVNQLADGTTERFGSLCFHGPGRSLEMRVFTADSFITALETAGFRDARIFHQASVRHGITLYDWPGPVVARPSRLHDLDVSVG